MREFLKILHKPKNILHECHLCHMWQIPCLSLYFELYVNCRFYYIHINRQRENLGLGDSKRSLYSSAARVKLQQPDSCYAKLSDYNTFDIWLIFLMTYFVPKDILFVVDKDDNVGEKIPACFNWLKNCVYQYRNYLVIEIHSYPSFRIIKVFFLVFPSLIIIN